MSDLLKPFILYCQSVEAAYNEWKNYWLKILTDDDDKKPELSIFLPHGNPDYTLKTWIKNIEKYRDHFG